MSTEQALELVALTRLGLGSSVPEDAPEQGLLDFLVARGILRRPQAQAVRSYVARHAVGCSCGQRSLAPEGRRAFACSACGGTLVKESAGGPWHGQAGPGLGVGSRIGPLELLAEIGRGASGSVFKARHVQLARTTAVKVLQAAALDARRRKRFEREVAALARLDHPSIVKVHATYEVGAALACEMELVAGVTLDALTERKGPLPWREAVALVAKIARATGHAHRAGVVHRDLKPANVLIREADGEPLLADFGLARFIDQASSLTAAGTLVGTPVYMAPEAFAGETGPEVDVYGLGTILYQALAGRPPFQETNLTALFYKISHGTCPPTAAPEAPPDLERVRARAMAPDAHDRHATPDELASDLEHVLRGEPIVVRARRRTRRAALTMLALSVGMAAILVVELARPRAPGPPAALHVDAALAVLDSPAGEARRAEAIAALVAATRPGAPDHDALVARIDSAVELAPASDELRRVRAILARQGLRPIEALDLAAALRAPEGARDLEPLAGHALTVGLVGTDAATIARSLWLARKDERSLALLFAMTACARGDAALRDEVVLALRGAGPKDERPLLLARVLADADRLGALVDRTGFAGEGPEDIVLARRLRDGLASLKRDPGTGTPELILAPVAAPLRAAWRDSSLGDRQRYPLYLELVGVLDVVLDRLAPPLLALAEVMRVNDPDKLSDTRASVERLDAAGSILLEGDPLLGSASLIAAAWRATLPSSRGDAPPAWALERLERAQRALEAFPRTPAPTNGERYWKGSLIHRCSIEHAAILERRAETGTEATRRRDLEAALADRRAALARSTAEDFLEDVREKDVRNVVRNLFFLDREAETESLVEPLAEREGVRAEILRRRGDPGGALALAGRAPPGCPEAVAVLALAEADLGHTDAARRRLEELRGLERKDRPFLPFLRAPAVAAHIAAKTR